MSISLDITETIIQLETSSGVSIELVAGAVVVVAGEGGGVTQEYVDNGDAATLASANLYADSAANDALSSANAATALVEDDLDALTQTVEDNLTTINDALALKADLVGGLVPAAQLPSFVDDVLEGSYINATTFNDEDGNPYAPESNKVYIDTTFNKSYRWSGSLYAPLDEGAVLGETSSTAYRGDLGKIAYDHSQATGNPHGTSFSDLLSQSALFNLVYSAYVIGSNTAILASDTLGQMLGKLQAQVNTLAPTTFNQSRWTFTDFDSGVNSSAIFHAGYIMGSIGTGTRQGAIGGVGTQGILRFISAAAANTGFYVSNASAVPNLHIRPLQGSCCLFVTALPSGGSSRLLTIGFDATTNWSVATMPTNSVHAKFTISGSTVSASCRRSVVGTTTTQGSTVLTDDVYYVYLVQYIADDQVRFVIWNLLTNVKVFDETIITDTPTTATGAILFHGVHATGSGTQALVDIDYIGRGIELPPYFVIPT